MTTAAEALRGLTRVTGVFFLERKLRRNKVAFAKELQVAKLRFAGGVMEVAKHELTVSTPEASSCVTGCKATSGAVTPKASD